MLKLLRTDIWLVNPQQDIKFLSLTVNENRNLLGSMSYDTFRILNIPLSVCSNETVGQRVIEHTSHNLHFAK